MIEGILMVPVTGITNELGVFLLLGIFLIVATMIFLGGRH